MKVNSPILTPLKPELLYPTQTFIPRPNPTHPFTPLLTPTSAPQSPPYKPIHLPRNLSLSQLVENYNSERILRKKYYNVIEDMKGKIRVYCRSRPLSNSEAERGSYSVVLSPDEYTIQVQSRRGLKEFSFDQVELSSELDYYVVLYLII